MCGWVSLNIGVSLCLSGVRVALGNVCGGRRGVLDLCVSYSGLFGRKGAAGGFVHCGSKLAASSLASLCIPCMFSSNSM